ncbi:hypothetical protein GALL_482270 [mine drainage metagenome]|uniref:Uncharacterized protein n=1 Tax=mine drainage metagenome TaxID=410659 RepID=A0A1J5PY23_9ZZZZ
MRQAPAVDAAVLVVAFPAVGLRLRQQRLEFAGQSGDVDAAGGDALVQPLSVLDKQRPPHEFGCRPLAIPDPRVHAVSAVGVVEQRTAPGADHRQGVDVATVHVEQQRKQLGRALGCGGAVGA